jgi:hypothetical protein
MSWLFSRALVEAYSVESCLDGEPSVPLNGNPIPQAYCAPDKMTDFSRLSRFGMTFKPLTGNRGEELLTLYLAGFPAKTSAAQEREQELPAADQDSGQKWQGLLAKYNHVTRSWKTAQCSLLADLEQSLEIWPRWGLMRDGVSYQQPTLVRRTLESESGLWLTPRASDTGAGEKQETFLARMGDRTDRCAQSLAAQVTNSKTWPTVTATANQLAPSMQARYKRPIWMTPTVSDAANRTFSVNSRGEPKLSGQVKLYPTPTSHNAKETGAKSQINRKTVQLGDLVGGSLNPTWVEWLMGWPLGWTDLKPLETVKCQQWQQQHSDF